VAGVVLGDIDRHFAWQVWYLATSTVTLRGRRGAWRHRPSLCVAAVAHGDIGLHFAWQVWHLATSTVTLRGTHGTYGTGLALVARLGPVWHRGRRGCLGGRHGAWRHGPPLCVAGVALRPSLCVAGMALVCLAALLCNRPLPFTSTHGVGIPVLAT